MKAFSGDLAFLSNFYPCTFVYRGLTWPSAEAAYQGMKTLDPGERAQFTRMSPGEAKRAGKDVDLRDDWEQVKLLIMAEILLAKFQQNPDLRKRLLATGTAYLEETNTWGDTYWGVCRGRGDNYLGRLLMSLRARL